MKVVTAKSQPQKDRKISQVHTPHAIINKKGPKYQLISQTQTSFYSPQYISHSSQQSPFSIKLQKSAVLHSSNQIQRRFEDPLCLKDSNQDSSLYIGIKVVSPFNSHLLNNFVQNQMTSTSKKQQKWVVTNSQKTNSSKKKAYFNSDQQTYNFEKLALKVTSSQVLSSSSAVFHKNNYVSNQSKFKTKKYLQDAKSIISQDAQSLIIDLNIEQSQLLERKLDIFDFVTPIEDSRCCNMCKAVDKRYNSLVTLKFFTQKKLDEYMKQAKIMQILGQLQNKKFLKSKQTLFQKIGTENKIIVVFQPFHKTLSEFIRKINLLNSHNQFLQFFNLDLIQFTKKLMNRGVYLVENLQLNDFVETEGAWKLRCLCKFTFASQSQANKIDFPKVVPYVWLQ